MKKLFALLLSVLMLCAMIPFATVSAAAEPTVVLSIVDDVEEVNAGDEFQIEVNLENLDSTAGLIGALVEIGYDHDVFELVTSFDEDEEMWMPAIEVGSKYNASTNKYITFGPIDDETGESKNCLVMYTRGDAKATQVRKEAHFFTATFKVKDDAASGTYELNVAQSDFIEFAGGIGGNVLSLAIETTSIKVNGSDPVPPVPPVPPVEECEHEYTYACDKACAKCGEEREASHNLVHIEAVEAGCHYIGNIEYWYCTECECFWSDEALTQITNSKSVIIPALGGDVVAFEAIEPGCHYNGRIAYWFCPECEQFWQDEALTQLTNSKNVILPATGSENLQHVEAKDPTCLDNGNIEYWFCSDCEQFWQDEALTQLTNSKNVILPAAGAHIYDDEFDADCNVCGEIRDVACNHTYEAVVTDPNCISGGYTTYTCSACGDSYVADYTNALGHVYDDEFDSDCNVCGAIRDAACAHEYTYACDKVCALCGELTNPNANHNIIAVEAVDATCYENGNIAYWYCEICGYAWADEALTQQTNLKSVVIPMAHGTIEHVAAVDATCFENGNIEYWYCVACGQAWLDEACTLNTNLKAVILPMAHNELTHVAAVAPSCYENGNIEYWYCEACGYAWLDAEGTLSTNLKAVVLPMAHAEATHVAAKASTCVENGNIEYWYCEACGQAWLDAECILNTNLKAVILPLADHVYDSEYDADCNVCGAIRQVVAAPGSINFVGNSVTEEVGGLAFLFEIAAKNVGIKWWNYYVNGSATVNYQGSEYTLVGMGAVLNNQGESDIALEDVDNVYTINIPAIRLYDLTEDALYFAVRAINMPVNHINTIIHARPYMILEKDGAQIVIYGDVQASSYSSALNG